MQTYLKLNVETWVRTKSPNNYSNDKTYTSSTLDINVQFVNATQNYIIDTSLVVFGQC